MKAVLIVVLLSGNMAAAQNNIAQFALWKPKSGLEQKFQEGYKQHLQWHKGNGDTWSWYGWLVVSGPRYGLFIDATFDHSWSDWDKPVNPAADRADNELHTVPFGDFVAVLKVARLPELCVTDSVGLKSKLLRLITVSVSDIPAALKVIEKLKVRYTAQPGIKNFQVYKVIDGGNINQLLILLGFPHYRDYGHTEHLQEDILAIESTLKIKVITGLTSETLVYRPDMSLFPE